MGLFGLFSLHPDPATTDRDGAERSTPNSFTSGSRTASSTSSTLGTSLSAALW
jgi:hypothetical protein